MYTHSRDVMREDRRRSEGFRNPPSSHAWIAAVAPVESRRAVSIPWRSRNGFSDRIRDAVPQYGHVTMTSPGPTFSGPPHWGHRREPTRSGIPSEDSWAGSI